MVDTNKKTSKEKRPPKRSIGRILGTMLLWLIFFGFLGALFVGGAGIGYVSARVQDDPVRSRAEIEQKMSQNSITGFAYFNDGTQIGQLRTDEDRRPVEFEKIPAIIKEAVIAIEDNDFSTHIGIDFKGTLRAVKQRVLNESIQTGGSTLTQQLARRVFLNLDRTDDRKIKEMLLSLRLERILSKDQIFAAYLNKVPFGNGSNGYNVYGIKAAAKGIFNISDLEKVNIAQAAYLAGLPQLPSKYSAFNGKGEFNPTAFNRAMDRQKLVLRRMLEEAKITNGEYNEALAFDIQSTLATQTEKAYSTYPYLMMETERKASEILLSLDTSSQNNEQTEKDKSDLMEEATLQLTTGGYRVYTTINKDTYSAMHKISENDKNFNPDSKSKGMEQTAAMLLDNKTGAILGMIEGRDFYEEQMNYATQMVRQPGSAMKPIAAYLPALDSGAIQPASIVDDGPIILKDGQKGFHIPKNSSRGYEGLVTARYALNMSKNTIALKLFNNVITIDKAWEFSKRLGITTIQEADYAATTGVLGGLKYGVSVEELTNAYSAIANHGTFLDAYMIEKITDSNGSIVYQHTPEPDNVFSEQTAYLMTDMLRTVITQGTASTVKQNYKHSKEVPIVGKTGSTQNYADVWFMGYSPDVTLGVWVGYKESVNLLEGNQRKNAQNIWTLIMNDLVEKKPDLFVTPTFEKPSGITSKTVSAYSGKLPSSLTDKYVTDLFNSKYVPMDSDDGIAKAKYITYNGVNYIPQDTTPEDMLKEKMVIKREYPIQDLIKDLQNAFTVMKKHESLEYYLPKDATSDMPTQIDPRIDDGGAPTAANDVSLSMENGAAQISFTRSGSQDVVGYRLYRSLSGNDFQHQGHVVRSDESFVFTFKTSASYTYDFYITAVDVAGHESEPSAIVGNSSSQTPDPPDEIIPELPGEGEITDPDQGDQDITIDDIITPPIGEALQSIPTAPGQPAIKSTENGLQLNWSINGMDTVDRYNVHYSKEQNGVYSQIGSSQRSTLDLNTTTALIGWYRVTAVNNAGESAPSASTYYEK
ncbi:transglycosylase domain-containing protein [Paenibacillus sp. FA6]|uniref:transglycosylase domain-containing protein n=1 Tax=Paenibacillus sp. FA6 TaxID=3413029 RepID=UPI003F65EC26